MHTPLTNPAFFQSRPCPIPKTFESGQNTNGQQYTYLLWWCHLPKESSATFFDILETRLPYQQRRHCSSYERVAMRNSAIKRSPEDCQNYRVEFWQSTRKLGGFRSAWDRERARHVPTSGRHKPPLKWRMGIAPTRFAMPQIDPQVVAVYSTWLHKLLEGWVLLLYMYLNTDIVYRRTPTCTLLPCGRGPCDWLVRRLSLRRAGSRSAPSKGSRDLKYAKPPT